MEKRLIEVKIQNRIWYYCPVNKYLHFDPKGIAGTFSLRVLTPEERADLKRQVDAHLNTQRLKMKMSELFDR
jgi:hypothetical protein